jgi:hypothetical protein
MPQNGIESILVERIISCAWRLRRVMRIESDMMHESLKFGFRHSLSLIYLQMEVKKLWLFLAMK